MPVENKMLILSQNAEPAATQKDQIRVKRRPVVSKKSGKYTKKYKGSNSNTADLNSIQKPRTPCLPLPLSELSTLRPKSDAAGVPMIVVG